MSKLSNEVISLYGLFKQYYRNPKYCSHFNYIKGLSLYFIKDHGFTKQHLQELINNKVIEQYYNEQYPNGGEGYRLTKEAVKDFMDYQGKPKKLLINELSY